MIPFISNLPFIGNCFKSEETHPKMLKQPFKVKVIKIIEANTLLTKIMWTALILLICVGGFMLNMPTHHARPVTANNTTCNQIPTYLSPYSKTMTAKILPDSPTALTSLPAYFHPKKIYGDNGRICIITKKRPAHEDCYKVNAYQATFSFIEKEVLSIPDFFEKNTCEIVESIKKTNAHINQFFSISSGELRKQMALLLDDHTKISRKGLRNAFYRYGGTPRDIRNFHSLYDKLEKYDILENTIEHLNEDELRVLKTIGFLPCLPKDIDSNLNKLAHQIKELAIDVKNRKFDAIAAAAFVHQELVKINPFMFGNKGTARIWMFIILQMGGYEAIFMPEQDYEFEIIKDLKSPGTFAHYLKKAINWNRKQPHRKKAI